MLGARSRRRLYAPGPGVRRHPAWDDQLGLGTGYFRPSDYGGAERDVSRVEPNGRGRAVDLPARASLRRRSWRRYLTASIILFAVASFLCGTSHSLVELVVWRIVQGAGGAALLSTAQATIRQIFPREQQGLVQAVFLLGIIVAPTLGPTLGGWITDNYAWNWCFFINVPIADRVARSWSPPSSRIRPASAPDRHRWTGSASRCSPSGWARCSTCSRRATRTTGLTTPPILRLSILAGICLVTMLWWELTPRNRHPIVNFRVLRNRELAASIFLFVALGFGLYGGVFIFPLFTQSLLHFTPTETGLALLPGGLATAATALICGRLLTGARPLVDPRVLIGIGVAIFVVAMWDLGHLTTNAGEPDVRLALIIRGAGLGFLFTPINNVAYASLKPQRGAAGGGPHQPRPPARRLVRHRHPGDVHHGPHPDPPGGSAGQRLSRASGWWTSGCRPSPATSSRTGTAPRPRTGRRWRCSTSR